VLTALILLQQVTDLPGTDRLARGLQNAAHGPWFAMVTWAVWQLSGAVTQNLWRRITRLRLTLLTALILALGSEFLQLFTTRDASVSDLLLDLLGAMAAIVLLPTGHRRLRHRLGIGFSLLLMTQYPLLNALVINAYQMSVAPRILIFDSPLARSALRTNSQIEVVDVYDGSDLSLQWPEFTNRNVLSVVLSGERWPGISIDGPLPDWTGYRSLVLDAYNPEAEPLTLHMSVRPQAPGGRGSLNFQRRFTLLPGANSMEVNLKKLLPPPGELPWHIRYVVLYSTQQNAGRHFYVGEMRLQP